MTKFVRLSVVGAVLVSVAFIGIIVYSAQTLPSMLSGSKNTLDQFFTASQRHQHDSARDTFTGELRGQLATRQLQNLWRDFEHDNGPITRWTPADSSVKGGGRICLWPRSVDYFYRVYGKKGGSKVFFARVVPRNQNWRIDQLRTLR